MHSKLPHLILHFGIAGDFGVTTSEMRNRNATGCSNFECAYCKIKRFSSFLKSGVPPRPMTYGAQNQPTSTMKRGTSGGTTRSLPGMAENPSVSQHVLVASRLARATAFTSIGGYSMLRVKLSNKETRAFELPEIFLSEIAFL